MNFIMPKETKTLSDLTQEQIKLLCQQDPEWVFQNSPHLVYAERPDWCMKFKPTWSFEHYTPDMVEHHPEWCAFARPATMASLDWDTLVSLNPSWVVQNQLERLLRTNPEIVKYYSQSFYETALKEQKPQPGRLDNWKLWASRFSAGQNLTIPPNLAKLLQPQQDKEEQTDVIKESKITSINPTTV